MGDEEALGDPFHTGQIVPVSGVYVDQHGNETVHVAGTRFPPCVHRNGIRGGTAERWLVRRTD